MGKFQIHETIDRPVEIVFRYMSDIRNTPHWYSAVQSARPIDNPDVQLGAKYEITRNLPQGRVTDVVSVTELDPPRAFAFGTDAGSTPFSYRYALTDADGATVVTLDGEIALSGAAKLLSPVATQAFKRGMQDNLRSLKQILEKA